MTSMKFYWHNEKIYFLSGFFQKAFNSCLATNMITVTGILLLHRQIKYNMNNYTIGHQQKQMSGVHNRSYV